MKLKAPDEIQQAIHSRYMHLLPFNNAKDVSVLARILFESRCSALKPVIG
jgi:hypothetical protein